VDDGAEAMVRSLTIPSYSGPINVGCGKGISIAELAQLIKEVLGYAGRIMFDPSKPDGAAHKTIDGSLGERLLQWGPRTNLREGIEITARWYVQQREGAAG
jgi:GDP-L-fucose synthase